MLLHVMMVMLLQFLLNLYNRVKGINCFSSVKDHIPQAATDELVNIVLPKVDNSKVVIKLIKLAHEHENLADSRHF